VCVCVSENEKEKGEGGLRGSYSESVVQQMLVAKCDAGGGSVLQAQLETQRGHTLTHTHTHTLSLSLSLSLSLTCVLTVRRAVEVSDPGEELSLSRLWRRGMLTSRLGRGPSS
jgi:hypothetical protein